MLGKDQLEIKIIEALLKYLKPLLTKKIHVEITFGDLKSAKFFAGNERYLLNKEGKLRETYSDDEYDEFMDKLSKHLDLVYELDQELKINSFEDETKFLNGFINNHWIINN